MTFRDLGLRLRYWYHDVAHGSAILTIDPVVPHVITWRCQCGIVLGVSELPPTAVFLDRRQQARALAATVTSTTLPEAVHDRSSRPVVEPRSQSRRARPRAHRSARRHDNYR